jgi:hypothetical protein
MQTLETLEAHREIKRHGVPKKFLLAEAVSRHPPRPRHWLNGVDAVWGGVTIAQDQTHPQDWQSMRLLRPL